MTPCFARIARTLATAACACALTLAASSAQGDAGDLRARYAQLQADLRDNAYHRPIHIDSSDAGGTLEGDIDAVVDHPYATLSRALENPDGWCAVMLLPFNTKSCRPLRSPDGTKLLLRIGRKPDQPVDEAYRLDFVLHPVTATGDYFESRLTAAQGPLGTHDYRITLAAIPLDARRTFVQLSYSYAYGGMGRFAMGAYLATVGASKVGFTVVGHDDKGRPVYIGGMRGVVERNVMRYYLAIEAHLASLSAPPGEQFDERLRTWFDSTERYARQLHEMDRAQYVALKREESGPRAALPP